MLSPNRRSVWSGCDGRPAGAGLAKGLMSCLAMVGVGRCRGLAPFSGGAVVTRPAWEGRGGWVAAALSGPRWYGDAPQPVVQRRSFSGVTYGPDVLDPVASDVEREHRHGDAVLLTDQTGLTVDRTLQERHVAWRPVGDFDPGSRDLLAAFDGAQEGSGEAAAVGDRRGLPVEQADQGVDVLGFPCRLERPDNGGLLGCRTRGSLRRANAAAG
jgi:hypothetical protein